MEVVIQFNNLNAKLRTTSREAIDLAYELLSFEVEGAKHTNLYKTGQWDGIKSLFHRVRLTFPTGFVRMLSDHLKENGFTVKYIDSRMPRRIEIPTDEEIQAILKTKTLRPEYQVGVVRSMLERQRGIVKSPTGSGKSLMSTAALEIARRQRIQGLMIVPSRKLLDQSAATYEKETGYTPGIVGKSKYELNREITVATIQTLYSLFKRDRVKLLEFLTRVGFLLIDEAHLSDSRSFQTVIEKAPNAFFKIGVTATPLMKGVEEDLMLIGSTGSIIAEIPMTLLIELGFLAQPLIKLVKVTDPPLSKRLPWPEVYARGIVHNGFRNMQVIEEAAKLARSGCKTLVLVSRKDHGKSLQYMVETQVEKLKSAYIDGDRDDKTRDREIARLEAGEIQILVASTIMERIETGQDQKGCYFAAMLAMVMGSNQGPQISMNRLDRSGGWTILWSGTYSECYPRKKTVRTSDHVKTSCFVRGHRHIDKASRAGVSVRC